VTSTFSSVVLWEGHIGSYSNAHGLTIYYISKPIEKDPDYSYYRANVNFALHTYWDEFLDVNASASDFPAVPCIDITNPAGGGTTVSYDTTIGTIGGTNSPLTDTTNRVVGSMWWTNRLNGANGEFAATSSWTVAGIPLSPGANVITVRGSNEIGMMSGDRVVMTRSLPFFLDITNANMAVMYDVTGCAVAGTNTSDIVGGMWVSNASIDGAAIAFERSGLGFAAPAVGLQVGTNVICVYGSNAADYISSDSVTITRGPLSSVAPYLDITNSSSAPLSYHVNSFILGGTNNVHVKGGMWWTNTSGGLFGTVSRDAGSNSWACTVAGLIEGTNRIRVFGTNTWDVQTNDTLILRRGYERDLPVLDPIEPGTVREHQVLLRQVTGRTNVTAVSCDGVEVIGASCFSTSTWLFSCVPEFNTASQVWNIAFVGMNQYGSETQTLVVTVAPRSKKITDKKPLVFEDVDGDLLDIKYSGVKRGSAVLFDGQNIVVTNAVADGKLGFAIKQNKATGDGSFVLRDVAMDADGKSASLAGNVDNVTAPQQSLESLKFTSKTAVASNIWLGWAKTISAGKGMIVGTVAVSNGFETLSAGAISGARILAGVAATADVTNTAATAGFKTVKATTMNNSIVAGRDTMKGDKMVTPEIKVKSAANSTFFHTGTNNAVMPEPILP